MRRPDTNRHVVEARALRGALTDAEHFTGSSSAPPDALARRLIALARCRLRQDGATMLLQPDRASPGEEILHWRYISLYLPPSLLISAACVGGCPPAGRVCLLDRSLAPSGPAALLHVHQGAVSSFEVLWVCLRMVLLTTDTPALRVQQGSKNVPAGLRESLTDAHWINLLRAAFVVREPLVDAQKGCTPLGDPPAQLPAEWHCSWQQLCSGAQWTAFTDRATPRAPSPLRTRIEEQLRVSLQTPDALRTLIEAEQHRERVFLSAALQRCLRSGEEPFGRVLMQYLRLKCMCYRTLVVNPAQSGFGGFRDALDRCGFYQRIVAVRIERADLYRLNLSTLSEPYIKLAAVELRGTLNPRRLRDTRRDAPAHIVHFTRGRAGEPRDGPLYGGAFKASRKGANKLTRLIGEAPTILRHFRGLDLAGHEVSSPLWLHLSHIRRVQQCSVEVANRRPGAALSPLRLTVHVGESFFHPASGLRAVHEPLAWNLLHRGDRLGHALVLGLDLQKRAQRSGVSEVTHWDRLLDLGWMHYCQQRFGLGVPPGLHQRWAEEATALIQKIWRQASPVSIFFPPSGDPGGFSLLDWLASAWLALGDPRLMTVLGYPASKHLPRLPLSLCHGHTDAAYCHLPAALGVGWLHQFLMTPSVRKRALEAEDISLSKPELMVLTSIQQALLRLLARWQITIEINPTSNFIIAGLDRLADQPMFQLLSSEEGSVPITISTDDPITFATCLSDEYAYAWAGAVGGGRSPSYARAWLEEAARNSMRARFVPGIVRRSSLTDEAQQAPPEGLSGADRLW